MPIGVSSTDGYLLLHKSGGLTSFDSLYQVKKALQTGKVGHTGTLDKFAEGLLVLLVGKYTSLVPLFSDLDKVYEGTVRFGQETDTLDPEGSLIAAGEVPAKETVLRVLTTFVGPQLQIPPAYSAIHVDGQRAHQRIRSGETVEMKPRRITIHSIEVLNYEDSRLTIRVHCSKGTYIRALARDIGREAGSSAYLEALRRVAVGPFRDEESVKPEPGEAGYLSIREALRPVDIDLFMRLNIPVYHLEPSDYTYILQGRPLAPLLKGYTVSRESSLLGLFDAGKTLLALVEMDRGNWKYRQVYPH